MSNKIKIIGIGNPLAGDDGVGIRVIEELKKKRLPENVEIIDAGCDPFIMLEHLDCKKVIVIDAVKMGKKAGSVVNFATDDVSIIDDTKNFSLHGVGLGYALKLKRKFYRDIDVRVIGIEPFDVTPGKKITDNLKQIIPVAVKNVMEEISKCN